MPAPSGAAVPIEDIRYDSEVMRGFIAFSRAVASPETVRGSELTRLQVSADLEGRYRDIRAFLYDLETSQDFVIIDSIVLGEGEEASSPLNLTLHVSTNFRGGAPRVP